MTTDYGKISADNKENAEQILKKVAEFVANLYSTQTHFIFELLQNAEDALGQIDAKNGEVEFILQENQFSILHNGKIFSKADVESICTFTESTKKEDANMTGKFGVGFKSVYRFTNTPHIFSGNENFKIKNYISPCFAERPVDLAKGETRIVLPFDKVDEENKPNKQDAFEKIREGLGELRGRDFLFLRHIKTLKWRVIEEDGFCITIKQEKLDDFARRVIITSTNPQDKDETWIVFSKGEGAKRVEIAFLQESGETPNDWKLTKCEEDNVLYCLFPITKEKTHLKFLVQGAFQTTPNRESIKDKNSDNNDLIKYAGESLIEILLWLKEQGKLDWGVFDCLPIEDKFFDNDYSTSRIFSPMAEKIRNALEVEELLPTNRGDFVIAKHAKLPKNDKLRNIFNGKKISDLFADEALRWLKAGSRIGIVEDFLSRRLGIEILYISDIMQKQYITETFMEEQSDNWIKKLYAFLFDEEFYPEPPKFKKDRKMHYHRNQWLPHFRILYLPLIRLTDDTHISPYNTKYEPQVYLSPTTEGIKGIKTIKSATVKTGKAKDFIEKLEIETYDDINGFIDEMRDRYNQSSSREFSPPEEQYKNDIERIIAIQKDDKIDKDKKEKFDEKLKNIYFVKAKRMRHSRKVWGRNVWKRPNDVYLATENFKTLFCDTDSVGIFLVDDSLMKKSIISMLIHYGAKDCLQYWNTYRCHLSSAEQKKKLIEGSGTSDLTPARNESDKNYDIEYLQDILSSFKKTPEKEWQNKARALWEELGQIKPNNAEYATAKTYYTYNREIKYEAVFVYRLNNAEWIPAPNGTLKKPKFVLFDELDWKAPKGMQSEIHFKKSGTKQLQESAGLGDELFEFAMEMQDIKNAIDNNTATDEQKAKYAEFQSVKNKSSESASPKSMAAPSDQTDAPLELTLPETIEKPHKTTGKGTNRIIDYEPIASPNIIKKGNESQRDTPTSQTEALPKTLTSSVSGGRVGGVANSEVEKAAIEEVQRQFPEFKDANHDTKNNPGFDLYEADENGKPIRWIEVKGKSEGHNEIPTMTSTQYGFALGFNALGVGHRYVHITVAHALTDHPQLYRTSDPAGKDKKRHIDNSEEIYKNEDEEE